MNDSKKVPKKLDLYEALVELKISHRLTKFYEKKYTGQVETLTNWKKLLKK